MVPLCIPVDRVVGGVCRNSPALSYLLVCFPSILFCATARLSGCLSPVLFPPPLPLSHSVCRSPLPISSPVISHLPPRTVNGVTIRLTVSDTFIKNESCPWRRAHTQTTKMITPSCPCELTAAQGVPDPNLHIVALIESDTLGDMALSYPQSVVVFFLNSKLPWLVRHVAHQGAEDISYHIYLKWISLWKLLMGRTKKIPLVVFCLHQISISILLFFPAPSPFSKLGKWVMARDKREGGRIPLAGQTHRLHTKINKVGFSAPSPLSLHLLQRSWHPWAAYLDNCKQATLADVYSCHSQSLYRKHGRGVESHQRG